MKNLVKIAIALSVTASTASYADWRDTRADNGGRSYEQGSNVGSRETRAENGSHVVRGENTGSRSTRSENGTNSRRFGVFSDWSDFVVGTIDSGN